MVNILRNTQQKMPLKAFIHTDEKEFNILGPDELLDYFDELHQDVFL
jgi:hypothetical protein